MLYSAVENQYLNLEGTESVKCTYSHVDYNIIATFIVYVYVMNPYASTVCAVICYLLLSVSVTD